MALKYIVGDLIKKALNHEFEVIVHGCNCFCNMGAGIAKQIKKEFPDAYTVDCFTEHGDREKLGTISFANQHDVIIVNAYTQFNYGGAGPNIDYDAVRSCMRAIKQEYSGKKIGMPLIGAGLAGGDWNVIKKIIATELHGENVTIVKYPH